MPSELEIEELEDTIDRQAEVITHLRAENERLRAALEPFAEAANRYDPIEGDDQFEAWDWSPTLGMLRRARAALAEGGDA